MPVTHVFHFRWRAVFCAWLLAALSPLAANAAFKASLQGLNAGGATWIDGNLIGWRELDRIPCRVHFTGGPAVNQLITIEFDHMRGTIPGVENLTGWTASPNVQIVSPPVLSAPIGAITWSYTFRVNVSGSQPGYVEFRARLSAGAHLNVGSSLALRGSPALGSLQIHKPSPGPGFPDLAILKRGPANAGPGETITYTITYTNKPTSKNASVGVQVRDMLPAELDIVTNSVTDGMIVGNSVIWDLGDLPIGATGTITYRATVKPGVAHGTSFSNYAQILSSENDDNPADNASIVTTLVNFNRAPIARDDTYTVSEDAVIDVPAPGVLANDTDADGNPLSVALPRPVSPPSHGALIFNANGSFIYTPNADFNGADTFTYHVTDGAATSAVAVVTITVGPMNDTPVAADDNYATDEDLPLTISAPGLLANDTDVDGDTLTATLLAAPSHGTALLNPDGSFTYTPAANFNGPDSFTYRAADGTGASSAATARIFVRPVNDAPVANNDSYATDEDMALSVPAPGILSNDSDIDGNALTASLVTNPAHGTIALNSDGSFTYTPVTDYHGPDSFTYKVNDGALDSSAATVSIIVRPINDAPVALNDSYSTDEDVPLIIAEPGILANDNDADGDVLGAVLVANPTNGTIALNSDGSFAYTARANFYGLDSFTYRASDGALSSGIATVSIQVFPQLDPQQTTDDQFSALEDNTLIIPMPGVLANDVSVDGEPFLARMVQPPQHGTLTLSGDGGFMYYPAPDFNGSDSFLYRAAAKAQDSLTSRVDIIVAPVNDQPSFTIASGHVVPIDSPLQTLANWATDIRSGPANEAGQILRFELSADQPALFEVQPAITPDGTLAYKPMPGLYGTARVTVVLKDDGGTTNGGIDTSIPHTFAITINAPPTTSIVVPTNGSVFVASANIPILVQAVDPDGVVTNLDLFAGTNLLFNATSDPYAFSWTNVPAGEYTLRARATDNLGATGDSETVTITVLERPPTLLLGPITLNLQSGLFEQRVRVLNPTPLDYEAIRVLITDLTPDVTIYNRSGMANGIPYVQPAASVPAGGSVDVVIEYYVPNRIPPNPTLRVELVQSSLPPENPAGQMVQITRGLRLGNQTFLIEWNSLRNRTYFIQYSDDMHTWKTVMPPVTGTGTRHQWIDNGPPKTDAFPVDTVCRFYRLILAQ